MIRFLLLVMVLLPIAAGAQAPPPLLSEPEVRALAAELSGTAAKRNLQDLTLFHRMRGSRGFRAAAERVRDRAREYGLQEVEILELPADGTIFYGTQRSRPAWDADFAELWEDTRLVASWQARPVVLAQDSASGEAEAELVDVGAGTSEAHYQGKEVRGRLVLTSSQPEGAYALEGPHVSQIRDDLSAIYGPVPLEEVAEYLDVLRRIKVLEPAEVRTPSAIAD